MTNNSDAEALGLVLAATTPIVAKYSTNEWQSVTLRDLALVGQPFKVYSWTGQSVRIADAHVVLIPHPEGYGVHKVMIGGLRFRCAALTPWPVLRRIEGVVSVTADALKSGDRVLIHGRFGKDALTNLAGYQRVETLNIAQVKTANENIALLAVKVHGGGSILLNNGVFVG